MLGTSQDGSTSSQMILEEVAHLSCSRDRAAAFFGDLEAQYRSWHPDHIAFRWVGPVNDHRSRYFFDERIGPLRLRLTMTARRPDKYHLVSTPVNPFWRIVFPGMTFAVEEAAAGCTYVHRIAVRLGPLAGILDRKILTPIRQHMAEEAVNLERLTR
jgi:hypothetical protein